MHETLKVSIRGVVPSIMCNGQTSDPLNPYSKQIKKISSKKSKTEDDHMEMARIEWNACMYINEKSHPCWPSDNLESMIIKAATKKRKGTDAKAGIFVSDHAPIIYEGPKTPEVLWNHKSFENNPFILRVPVTVNRNKVMRTRPIFRDWAIDFEVNYLKDMFDESQIVDFLTIAGRIIGLSDWRPKYGRFEVTSIKSVSYDQGEANEQEESMEGSKTISERERIPESVSY